jgi:polar amino acid transport system substrate-binding protein
MAMARRIIATLAAAAVMAGTIAVPVIDAWAQQGSPATVTIPNFWDPRRRIDRPATTAIQTIRFLTTDDFPPFNFLDDHGRLVGFNVDLARAICTELGIRCTIQARQWDDLVGHLGDGTADAVIAGIAVTPENRRVVDFSDVYLRPAARFVVRRDAAIPAPSPQALTGKTLAVAARTAHEAYLAAMFPEVARHTYPNAEEARRAVRDGEADAVFGDGLQLSFWLSSRDADGCCTLVGGPYLESRFFGQGYAVAVAIDATVLKGAINAALQAVAAKGVYAELYLRYFPGGFF